MGWFRERRKLRRFTSAVRQVSEERFQAGEITEDTLGKFKWAADHPKTMRQLMRQTEVEPGLYGGIQDWDWDAILKWVREYFLPLMKALLPLLLVLDNRNR